MLRSFILFAGLVLALGLAGCPQQAQEPAEDTEMVEEGVVIEEVPADAVEEAPAEAEEAPAADAPADSGDDASDGDDSSY